ncbi:MAG: aminotransferase class III-fold pyridoxal phosphate-dependent enzyme, partial [Myxococcales bacterium]|nr:aminotransferase class III-fold pyridoxal phosphate-dependent enzyme [Myxococcales bacterium]
TYPVALTSLPYGESSASSELKKLLNDSARSHTRVNIINTRHEIEKIFELFGINSEAAAQNKLIYLKNSFADFKEFSHEFYIGISKIFADAVVIDEKYLKFNLNFIKNADDCINNLKKYLEEVCAKTGLNISKYKPLKIAIPKDMQIPRSRAMLDRLYQGNFVPKEKKAPVADLYRSRGAYLASVDDEPLILFDAASQIATIGAGFNADTLQNSYDRGDFDGELAQNYDLSNQENDLSDAAYNAVLAKKQLEDFLHHQSDHIFKSVSYGASGAEANEISFDLCRQHGPGGTRIIAFEGAFHGRTIMALQATYNKEKRGPFMFEGFEAHFVPFPKMDDITEQPKVNLDHLRDLSLGIIPQVEDSDSLLDLEIHSLRRVKEEVEHGNICAVIVEPMQCEGGDRYASYRFFNYLRALTRGLKVPLIFDEVQTGFHLGQKFFWHQQFDLKDANGKRDYPDCISLGKKAQLGIVMSVWDNHRDYSPHVIQLKRGLLQAKVITTSMAITTEAQAKKELKRLQENFPDLVQNTRACGFAFAFDMPTSKLANDLINQRFERGFMAYIAGEKTLRFRLNMTTGEQIINSLFKKLFVALVDMQEGHSFKRTAVPIINDEDDLVQLGEVELIELTTGNFDDHIDEIHAIEKNTYEEGRRDSMDKLREWLSYESSLGLLVKCKHEGHSFVGGYIIGGPLEYANIDGPLQDSMRNKNNTFYSANLSVDPRVRGRGLGRILKNEQIRRVKKMKKEDGHERYHFLTGRNRLDRAQAMTHINEQLGAYSVAIYDNQYGAEKAKALYYRLPLKKSEHICDSLMTEQTLDCSNTIQPAFHSIPKGLERDLRNNYFRAFTGSKLTLSNWATPNLIRYSELLRALMPKHLKHSYFTSGRDEVVDKGLRSIRYHRLEADMVIGFSHQWLGNITAAARSLSHDQGQSKPFKWFDWPHVAHPQIVGAHESLNQIQQILKTTPSNKILAFVVELMGEKSALSFDDEFLQKLDDIRKQTSIPLVFVETTSSLGRSGKTLFLSDSLSVKANMVWWYTGGQLGHVFVDDNYFVEKPLTLISTWDGDEISINRAYHYLLAASERSLRLIQQFSSQLQELFDNEHHRGQGCWHGVKFRNISAHDAQRKAKELSVQCGIGFDDWLMVCARSDFSSAQFEKILVTLKEIIDCDQA